MNLDEILNGIQLKQSREETKEVIRKMKADGITKEETKVLYVGFISMNQKHIMLLPLLLLWVDEVYKENKE